MFSDLCPNRYPTSLGNRAKNLKLHLCAEGAVRYGGSSRGFFRKHQLAEMARGRS